MSVIVASIRDTLDLLVSNSVLILSSVSVIEERINRSSQTRAAVTLVYAKRSRVSWIRAIMDTDMGDKIGQVKFLL